MDDTIKNKDGWLVVIRADTPLGQGKMQPGAYRVSHLFNFDGEKKN